MFSPLIENIIKREGLSVVDKDSIDPFLQNHDDVLLMVAGDAKRLGEVDDVAVILPELIKVFNGRLTPAIAASDSEPTMQMRFGFTSFPSLIFLRRGEYLGTISGVLDWSDYLNEIQEILTREPTQPPLFELKTGCNAAAAVH